MTAKIRAMILTAMAVAVAACGGGGNTITDPPDDDGNGGGGAQAASLELLASSPQLASDLSGAEVVLLTAVVKDANNVLLPDVAVSFSANAGGSISVINSTSDENGQATARLGAGSDLSNRPITVTASAGSVSDTVTVNVAGTAVTADCLPVTIQSGGTSTCTVQVKDSKGVGLAGQTITVTSALGNTLSSNSLTTGTTGSTSFTVTGTQSGTDTITVSALNSTVLETLEVLGSTGEALTFTAPASDGAEVTLGSAQNVTAVYTVNGVPTDTTINFTSTRGTLSASSQATVGGAATVTISSNTAGASLITATVGSSVLATRSIEFVATTPASLDLQVDPFTVRINQESAVTAVVRDANGNPVKNQLVAFQIVSGPGTLTVAQATTDSQGRARSVYVAGDTSTAVNGVVLRAHVINTTPEVADTVNLTVSGQALAISLGTGNDLFEIGTATFAKEWVIFVSDADGNAVPNKPVQVSIRSTRYAKGTFNKGADSWVQSVSDVCLDEDSGIGPDSVGALNGILDSDGVETEDFNGSGVLEAGNIALVAPVPASAPANAPCASAGSTSPAATVTTDSQGRARVCIFYPQSYNLWVESRIGAKTSVAGTEFGKSQTFWLPASANDINDLDADPPGSTSPFGTGVCTDPPPP